MSQIAEQTGIGRATLYKYFPDIEAILLAWHDRQITTHLAYLAEVRDQTASIGERLEAVLEAYALLSRHARGHHDAGFAAVLHRDERVARAERQVHQLIRDLLAAAAEAGRSETMCRPTSSPATACTPWPARHRSIRKPWSAASCRSPWPACARRADTAERVSRPAAAGPGGGGHAAALPSLTHSAHATRPSDARASSGWIGANSRSAPLAPTARTTSLLQTGQPIANSDSSPPPAVRRPPRRSTPRLRTYVAAVSPMSSDEATRTG